MALTKYEQVQRAWINRLTFDASHCCEHLSILFDWAWIFLCYFRYWNDDIIVFLFCLVCFFFFLVSSLQRYWIIAISFVANNVRDGARQKFYYVWNSFAMHFHLPYSMDTRTHTLNIVYLPWMSDFPFIFEIVCVCVSAHTPKTERNQNANFVQARACWGQQQPCSPFDRWRMKKKGKITKNMECSIELELFSSVLFYNFFLRPRNLNFSSKNEKNHTRTQRDKKRLTIFFGNKKNTAHTKEQSI